MTTTNDAPAPSGSGVREALSVEERLLERTAQVAELFNENRQLRAARCGGRWKALFETAHAALVCIAEAQADALYARKVADELTVASLASDASPRGEAVAWRLIDSEGDHWWGPSCRKEQFDKAAVENPDLIVQPLYAHPAPATVESEALRALYEWYDRDGSVGGASEVFEQHRAALAPATEGRKS